MAAADYRQGLDMLEQAVAATAAAQARLTQAQLLAPSDARVLALNSYENRVYQVGIEDATPLIAKFYRPDRWSDAAIREEHTFSAELAECDIPVVAPLMRDGETLFTHAGFRFALFPRRGGRAPEPGNLEQLYRLGQLLGRLHGVGASKQIGRAHV